MADTRNEGTESEYERVQKEGQDTNLPERKVLLGDEKGKSVTSKLPSFEEIMKKRLDARDQDILTTREDEEK